MAELTDQQVTDIRADLGIADDAEVFTDPELDRLYTRAGSDYDRTVALAIRQLLVDASKLNDYTAGSSTEKKSQVFDQLKEMYAMWAEQAGMGRGRLSAGVIDLDFAMKDGI